MQMRLKISPSAQKYFHHYLDASNNVKLYAYSFGTHTYVTHMHTCTCRQEQFIVECVNFVASRAPRHMKAGTVLTREMVVVILSSIQTFIRFVSKYKCSCGCITAWFPCKGRDLSNSCKLLFHICVLHFGKYLEVCEISIWQLVF